ncbi:NUDIX hydrolase [Microvirga flavescens]|uniref:NUDIX hydrolase n=1 Tax=Microvirga flavescens TaxID=2249811 RepID=UPI000DD99733|nr:NUDIX hydrolase [Microvirga flavescens]
MNQEILITHAASVEARVEEREWPWAVANRERIAANWQRRKALKPKMFNGRVLALREMELNADKCRMVYSEMDYSDFVGWLDLPDRDTGVANGFAVGALQGSDGGFICGVMADHTANAGRVYFAAGTPDRSDVLPDGTVDLATSLTRELEEETGLATGYAVSDDWIVVRRWPAVALVRQVVVPEPADALAERIRANIVRQEEPELSDVRIVRGPADIDPKTMPQWLQTFFAWRFS